MEQVAAESWEEAIKEVIDEVHRSKDATLVDDGLLLDVGEPDEEPGAHRHDLLRRGETDRILRPRFVLTDKHEGLRTPSNDLSVKVNARLVVPGFKDHTNLMGKLRRDAPTGSRIAQHLLFSVAAWHQECIMSADVKAAFLKGDPYLDRELYVMGTDSRMGPPIPIPEGCLARVRKGISGSADAPRQFAEGTFGYQDAWQSMAGRDRRLTKPCG